MTLGRWVLAVVGAAFLVSGATEPAAAQTSWPRITSVAPAGGQRGTTVELTVAGINVDAATGLLFEGSGITVESVTPEKPAAPAANAKPAADAKPAEVPRNRPGKLVARVRIAPDAQPGARAMRVLTSLGPSDVATFVVGQWPEVADQEPNNTREQAQPVTFPCTVVGQVSPAEDVDCFRFQARAGQTLVFDVLAARLESALDSILFLQDAAGREAALNEDFNGIDSMLAFEVPRDGEYFLCLRDLRYQGSANHHYRLSMGEIPYVTSVFPPGGGPGETVELELNGFNLGDTRATRVQLPAEAPSGMVPLPLPLAAAVSNPVTLTLSEVPRVTEIEPNDEPSQAQTLNVPGAVSGRIDARGGSRVEGQGSSAGPRSETRDPRPSTLDPRPSTDADCFRFRATSGQRLVLEIMARRYGSELDSLLVVTDASGKEVAVNDDGAGKDSRLEFTAPAAGEYVARITDLQGREGPGYSYQFSIRIPAPDFSLTFTPDRLALSPGGRVPLTVTAQRLSGFDGEIAVEFAGLPEGVSVVGPSRIRAGQREANLVLTAAPDAALQTTAFRVTGAATIDGKLVRRLAQGLEEIVRNNQKSTRPVNLWTAAVTVGPELVVAAAPEKLTLAKGGSVEITVTVERKEGFKGKVPLAVLGLPPNAITVTAPDIPEDKSEGKITLKAEDRAVPGELEIVVAGRAVIDGQRQVLHVTPPMLLTVIPAAEEKK